MMSLANTPGERYRIWVAAFDDWRPGGWQDVPPRAVALEPADDAVFSPVEAKAFLEGFNTQMLRLRRQLWAVAVPVAIRYAGDARAGQDIAPDCFLPAGRAAEPVAISRTSGF